ncbi:MAG: hypothetical protein KAT53_00195 [Dehalococcoidia bacterium]|nr:hypothetical protein [Dehalococcoidia bacterium]
MSEEEETFVVAMKVKDMPTNPIPSVKLICSGGCGDEVWVDKNLERLWSKLPVLCMECALEKMGSMESMSFAIAPESIESLMEFLINRDKPRAR